jgi:hypothetical protein
MVRHHQRDRPVEGAFVKVIQHLLVPADDLEMNNRLGMETVSSQWDVKGTLNGPVAKNSIHNPGRKYFPEPLAIYHGLRYTYCILQWSGEPIGNPLRKASGTQRTWQQKPVP